MKRNIFIKSIIVTLFLIITGILFFGLRAKGYNPENNIIYNHDMNSLSFVEASTAFSDKAIFKEMPDTGELSMEIIIAPQKDPVPEFRFIILAYANSSKDQLLIGEWENTLVIMNGDDYSNSKHIPKIYTAMNVEDKIIHVIISSDDRGTSVYLNGELAAYSKKLKLNLPSPRSNTRLVLGNSISDNNQWIGKLYALAFYQRTMGIEAVKQHYSSWKNNNEIKISQQEYPYLIFNFDNFKINFITDNTGQGAKIILPDNRSILNPEFLSLPDRKNSIGSSFYADIIINFTGFIPFGFFLFFLLRTISKQKVNKLIFITLLSGFLLSLIIELAQAWMPLRDSSLLDLILNTTGSAAGALFCHIKIRLFKK